jgi:hypothetical protein
MISGKRHQGMAKEIFGLFTISLQSGCVIIRFEDIGRTGIISGLCKTFPERRETFQRRCFKFTVIEDRGYFRTQPSDMKDMELNFHTTYIMQIGVRKHFWTAYPIQYSTPGSLNFYTITGKKQRRSSVLALLLQMAKISTSVKKVMLHKVCSFFSTFIQYEPHVKTNKKRKIRPGWTWG